MLDRASTFADKEIIAALKSDYIPVAIDQAYQRRQKDAEGEFYRKIAGKGPRNNFQGTTQGLYVAGPDGTFLGYSNHRDPARIKRMMRASLEKYTPTKVTPIVRGKVDERYNPVAPQGGLVIRVQTKVLGGYEETDDKWLKIFQSSVSRDNLWLTQREHKALVEGQVPRSLSMRLARFHLVDNTRGEPPMWKTKEVRSMVLALKNRKLHGKARLETDSKDRGYEADLTGAIVVKDGKVTQFDLTAQGQFWGEGRYTRRAPKGKFPLAVSFTLADGCDIADGIPPQGSRGWVKGYLESE